MKEGGGKEGGRKEGRNGGRKEHKLQYESMCVGGAVIFHHRTCTT